MAAPMVVFEEDVEEACKIAVRILGPVGRIYGSVNKGIIPDANVYTKEHGKLWYGDLTSHGDDMDKLDLLQKELGVQVGCIEGELSL